MTLTPRQERQTDMSPSPLAESVTPHDTTNFANGHARALWVGTLGNVVAVMSDGTAITFVNVQGLLPIQCMRVNSTSTTASNIVALF